MTRLTIAIIEDDLIIAESISRMLSELGYIVLNPANTYQEALDMLENNKPDFILIDIMLGGKLDGIELADFINKTYKIPFIYLTANGDKKTVDRAKMTFPASYLLKPFTKMDLYTSIEVATTKVKHLSEQVSPDKLAYIKDGNRIIKININEIYYFESEHVYIKIITTQQKQLLIRSSFKDLINQLKVDSFVQTHRSFVVNLNHVTEIKPTSVIMGEYTIPVSRNFRQYFQERATSYGLK